MCADVGSEFAGGSGHNAISPDGSARPPVGRDNHTVILPGTGVLTWSRLLVSSRLQLWWRRDPHSAHITDRRQGGGGGSEGAGHRQDEHDDTTTQLGLGRG